MSYEIRLVPKHDAEGNIYWTAFFPAIAECVGGGDTPEEAIREANENLEFYLDFLKQEKKEPPPHYTENNFSGKIALRIPKSTHQRLSDCAEREGVSANTLIVAAIENYIGLKQYDYSLEDKISKLQDIQTKNLNLQVLNFNQQWVPVVYRR